jgi:site-specific DNA recombinase
MKKIRREPQQPGRGARIVGYLRHSDPRQIHSVPQQRAELVKRAEAEGWQVVEVFADEGKSGTTDAGRDQFLAMIDYCLDRHAAIDAVVLWEFSRWARNENDFAFYMAALERQGIAVVSMKDPMPEGPAAGIVKAAYAFAAAEESRNIARRVKRGLMDAVRRGQMCGGRAPVGYRHVWVDGAPRRQVDPEKAPLVQTAFQMYANGYTMKAIHKATGLFPIVGSYEHMFSNPVYVGTMRWGGQEFSGLFEAIIDVETWQRAQARKRERMSPRRRASVYLLSGLLRCGHCGALLKGHTTKERRYYICNGQEQALDSRCPSGHTRAEMLEKDVIDRVLSHLSVENLEEIVTEVAASAVSPAVRRLAQVEADIVGCERVIANLWAAVEAGSAAARAQLLKREGELASFQARRQELMSGSIEDGPVEAIDREAVLAALAKWRNSVLSDDVEEKRVALRGLIERVTLTDNRVQIDYRPIGLQK